ncbi:MAG: hypothetical protein ABI323_12260 [Solirubrobacteraceae bacterium]
MLRLARPLIAALTLMAGVVSPAAQAAVPTSAGPLLWTAPGAIDSSAIDSVACPAKNVCVAVDRAGRVLWSTNPLGGTRRWLAARVDAGNELSAIACPSTSLCVAVDAAGNVITSQNPTGGQSTWTVAKIDSSPTEANSDNTGPVLLRGVSCPSAGLCVAVDGAGNALVSTDPAGGAAAWTITHADTNRTHGCGGAGLACQPPLVGVSCPTIALCAAVDFSGNILTTQNPAVPGPWSSAPTAGNQLSSLWGVSCPVVGFCATVNGTAGRAITFNPAAPASQRQRSLPDGLYGIWCQSASLCLASAHTQAGVSGLLGSYNPAAPTSTWSLSSLGGITAVACPSAAMCVAVDGEGEVAAGLTTHAIERLLRTDLLRTRHLPTIAALDRTPQQKFVLTSPIPARVTLVWTVPGAVRGAPVTIASGNRDFGIPGTGPLTLRLTTAGVRRFRAATKRLTVTATATFTTGTGSLRTVSSRTFTHPPKPKKHRRKRRR